jgi:hypothetical protein
VFRLNPRIHDNRSLEHLRPERNRRSKIGLDGVLLYLLPIYQPLVFLNLSHEIEWLTLPWKYRIVGLSRSDASNIPSSNFDNGGKGSRAWYVDFGLSISWPLTLINLNIMADTYRTCQTPRLSPSVEFNLKFRVLNAIISIVIPWGDIRASPYFSGISYSAHKGHGTQCRNINLNSATYSYIKPFDKWGVDVLFLKPWNC